MEAMPDYRKERRDRQEREREEELRKRRRAAARNQEKALRMSKSYVVFLTMAVTVFGVFCGAYIKLQSDVTARMKAIASLESQVTDLKADNDEAYKRINTAVDLDAIKAEFAEPRRTLIEDGEEMVYVEAKEAAKEVSLVCFMQHRIRSSTTL